MKIKTIDEIETGDLVVLQTTKDTIGVYKVSEVVIDENLLLFEGMITDYSPDKDIVVLDENY